MKDSTLPKQLIVVIMAGGLGKRMESDIPKVLHKVANKPMIVRIIQEALKLEPRKICVVVGKYSLMIAEVIREYGLYSDVELINQGEPMGTGHALMVSCERLKRFNHANVLILSGDVPLITKDIMKKMVKNVDNIKICIGKLRDASGYGRVKIEDKKFVKIIEHKDCNEKELKIKHFNTGIYCIDVLLLCKYIYKLDNNNVQREYYLTDIVELIKIYENIDVEMYKIPESDQIKVMGVNNPKELKEINCYAEAVDLAF